MRQFNYFYTSFMENKHGFISLIPHAKVFHPYFGLYDIGYNGYAPKLKPYKRIIDFFHKTSLQFKHKVKIFFPEIRKGMIYIDKIKYSVVSNPIDEVSIKHSISKNTEFLDYVPIENHIAEFEIDIEVFTKYSGVHYPIEIHCDYIDILLYKQRISLTETVQTIKIIPYFGVHHTDNPLKYLNYDSQAIISMKNTNLTYTVTMPVENASFLDKIRYPYTEAKSVYSLIDKGTKIILINLDAFITDYAAESNSYFSDSLRTWPLLNDEWMIDSCSICTLRIQSLWYTTVYDKNFTYEDGSFEAKCNCNKIYPTSDTRGYVWYKIFNDYSLSEKELTHKARLVLPKLAMPAFNGFKEYMYKEKR